MRFSKKTQACGLAWTGDDALRPGRTPLAFFRRWMAGEAEEAETASLVRINSCAGDAPASAAECWALASDKAPRAGRASVCAAATVRRGTPASVVEGWLRYHFHAGCSRAVLFFEDPH